MVTQINDYNASTQMRNYKNVDVIDSGITRNSLVSENSISEINERSSCIEVCFILLVHAFLKFETIYLTEFFRGITWSKIITVTFSHIKCQCGNRFQKNGFISYKWQK